MSLIVALSKFSLTISVEMISFSPMSTNLSMFSVAFLLKSSPESSELMILSDIVVISLSSITFDSVTIIKSSNFCSVTCKGLNSSVPGTASREWVSISASRIESVTVGNLSSLISFDVTCTNGSLLILMKSFVWVSTTIWSSTNLGCTSYGEEKVEASSITSFIMFVLVWLSPSGDVNRSSIIKLSCGNNKFTNVEEDRGIIVVSGISVEPTKSGDTTLSVTGVSSNSPKMASSILFLIVTSSNGSSVVDMTNSFISEFEGKIVDIYAWSKSSSKLPVDAISLFSKLFLNVDVVSAEFDCVVVVDAIGLKDVEDGRTNLLLNLLKFPSLKSLSPNWTLLKVDAKGDSLRSLVESFSASAVVVVVVVVVVDVVVVDVVVVDVVVVVVVVDVVVEVFMVLMVITGFGFEKLLKLESPNDPNFKPLLNLVSKLDKGLLLNVGASTVNSDSELFSAKESVTGVSEVDEYTAEVETDEELVEEENDDSSKTGALFWNWSDLSSPLKPSDKIWVLSGKSEVENLLEAAKLWLPIGWNLTWLSMVTDPWVADKGTLSVVE